jgi:hypothetical protein
VRARRIGGKSQLVAVGRNKMAARTWGDSFHSQEAEKEYFSLDRRKKRQVEATHKCSVNDQAG